MARRRGSATAAITVRSRHCPSPWRPTRPSSRRGRRRSHRCLRVARPRRPSSILPRAGRRNSSTHPPLPPDHPVAVVAL